MMVCATAICASHRVTGHVSMALRHPEHVDVHKLRVIIGRMPRDCVVYWRDSTSPTARFMVANNVRGGFQRSPNAYGRRHYRETCNFTFLFGIILILPIWNCKPRSLCGAQSEQRLSVRHCHYAPKRPEALKSLWKPRTRLTAPQDNLTASTVLWISSAGDAGDIAKLAASLSFSG